MIRDAVETCTGDGGLGTEDENDYCLGWKPVTQPNCTKTDEFK